MSIFKKTVAALLLVPFCFSTQAQNDNQLLNAFKKSYQLEKNKDYEGAIDVVKAVPGTPSYEANLRLGWLNYKIGFNKSASAYYESAIAQMPNAIEAKIAYSAPAYAMGNLENVIAQDKKVLEADPNNTTVNYNLGSIFYYKDDFKTALGYFEKILTLYPFNYDAMLMAAWTNFKMNKKPEAEALFNKVLLYMPTDPSALEGLTALQVDLTKENKLLKAFTLSYKQKDGKPDYTTDIAALKEVYDKTSYEINLRLGWLHYSSGMYKEAIAYYKTAIELKPNAIEPHLGIVYPIQALGNMSELIEHYKTILTIDPQNATANYRLGYIFYEKKDYPASVKYFEKTVNLYPLGYDALLMYAWTNYRLGSNNDAKAQFNKVLLLYPTDKSALEGLALIK
jgi:tetratricopeptide (TPR) repeat protein